MKKRTRDLIRRIARHPLANFSAGLILFVTSLVEVIEGLDAEAEGTVGAHHGVLLLGLLYMIRAVPDLVETLDFFDKVAEAREARAEEGSHTP